MARPNNLTMCSFCGKGQSEVRKLIAGPGVYICDSCITICKGILEKELKLNSALSCLTAHTLQDNSDLLFRSDFKAQKLP